MNCKLCIKVGTKQGLFKCIFVGGTESYIDPSDLKPHHSTIEPYGDVRGMFQGFIDSKNGELLYLKYREAGFFGYKAQQEMTEAQYKRLQDLIDQKRENELRIQEIAEEIWLYNAYSYIIGNNKYEEEQKVYQPGTQASLFDEPTAFQPSNDTPF